MNFDCISTRTSLPMIALLLAFTSANASTAGTVPCTSFTFPYTLAGSDNSARIAELRAAIECANANASDDVIDLGGNTLAFSDGTYASTAEPHGNNALPVLTSNLTLQNGSLQRDSSAPAFRFIQSTVATSLLVDHVTFQRGVASDEGGAILAAGDLIVRGSNFEDNSAPGNGGALSATGNQSPAAVLTSRFSGNTSVNGAAIAFHGDSVIFNSRLLNNGDASSQSIISVDGQGNFGIVNSLLANHVLSASGSALVAIDAASPQASLLNNTFADNTVQADLFATNQNPSFLLANSIVWGNSYTNLGIASVGYSLVQEAALAIPGTGNINQNPRFVDPANDDYHLASASAAIDAGNTQFLVPDFLDIDGDGVPGITPDLDLNPRVVDDANVIDTGATTNNVPPIDMGAFERQTDSDPPSVVVDPISGLSTSEADGSATFSVVLSSPPGSAASLSLASSNTAEGTVAPTSLTFTTSNWSTPQSVTVTGVDDSVADGDVAYTIVTSPIVSADQRYANLNPADVAITNVDDDVADWTVGGNVSGLLGGGLQLSLNSGAQTLSIPLNGNFSFAAPLPSGSSYAVTIATQPSNPTQACVLINGSGSVGNQNVANIIVNCGPANTYTVGGSLSGLAVGASLTLDVNGGNSQTLSLDGSWVFAPRFAPGDGYAVTIRTQPQGQHCTLANASGSVGTANVSNVNVSCAAGGPHLNLSVDDGVNFAAYSQVRDYYVTLSNSGNDAISNVSISATFDAAFDAPNVRWICINGAAGATCNAQGVGGFDDTASLPPGTTLVWVVSVPVRGDSQAGAATLTVNITGSANAANAADTDTLVIFRDGFDVPYGDGAHADVDPAAVLDGPASMLLTLQPAKVAGISTLRVLHGQGLSVAVQHLALDAGNYVRLLAQPADGEAHATAWTPALTGAQLSVGSVTAADNTRVILLEGAAEPLQLLHPTR